jgi:hypothetical protein
MTDRTQPSPLYGLAIELSERDGDVSDGTRFLQAQAEDMKDKLAMVNRLAWKNAEPRMYLARCVERFGLPTAFSPHAGGIAIWEGRALKDTPLYRFEIRDEAVLSDHKESMVNFVYAYVKYEVLPKCAGDISRLDCCISIDNQTKLLRVRSSSYSSCIALQMLATAVGMVNV